MILRPVIASYSGQTYKAIRRFLDRRALDIIVRIAGSPLEAALVDRDLLDNLVEMHVFAHRDGLVKLDTAVFLEEDIKTLWKAASEFGTELANSVADTVSDMKEEPPEVTNFIVGIIGIGQTLAQTLRQEGLVVDWRNYCGRYAQGKVDFDEMCDAYAATGEDFQNKTILRGSRYTAVFIGPGGTSYQITDSEHHRPTSEREYTRQLNLFLTDAYAMLITGEIDDIALRRCAEQAGLFRSGMPVTPVLTNHTMAKYLPTIGRVRQITHAYVSGKLREIRSLLESTTCGRQGVPPANMMLNFWRYMRKSIARQLYSSGLFRDAVPDTGLITVFFENNVEILNDLLK